MPRVLVVEDEPEMAMILRDNLELPKATRCWWPRPASRDSQSPHASTRS